MQLTTSQFTAALARHIDESKPDPLAKKQIESLCLHWEQEQFDGVVEDDTCGDVGTNASSLRGKLTLSSEYIAISIHVVCRWRKSNQRGQNDVRSCNVNAAAKIFQEEFFIKLTATASESERTVSSKEANKQDRKDRKAAKKLRIEMLKRLRSDHYIRQLFGVDEANVNDCSEALLCEALIQQNLSPVDRSIEADNTTNDIDELEERVNVEEGTLQGIKNAIFTQSEDNLDVLEIILNMPYLPRSPAPSSENDGGDAGLNQWYPKLAERAYLRLLEDAMFDACEKEGEDDLLDDLNISEADCDHHRSAKSCKEEDGRGESSKRLRNNHS